MELLIRILAVCILAPLFAPTSMRSDSQTVRGQQTTFTEINVENFCIYKLFLIEVDVV